MIDLDDISAAKDLYDVWGKKGKGKGKKGPKSISKRIGIALVLVGIIGYVLVVPSLSIQGADFVKQLTVDANGVENFGDYDTGDIVTIIDTISRMEYAGGETSIWLESIGKSDKDVRFIFSQNLMNDFGVGSNVVITFDVITSGQSETAVNEEINTRPSTMYDYIFILLTVAGIGLVIFGFVRGASKKIRPNVVEGDWGAPAPPAMAPAPPAMAPAPPAMAPAPPAMAPAPPTSMTITVPPGVVSGQVLTVTMPNGQVVNVQVPPGCASGSQFTISVTQ